MKIDNHTKGQVLLVKHLHAKALPGSKVVELNHAIKMAKKGILKADGLFEVAISLRSDFKHTPVAHKDFSDGSDAKTAVAFLNSRNCIIAVIKNIKSKIGKLRCIVCEPTTEKIYYFKIPKSAYRNQKSITISGFKVDGTPNFGKWAKYQVKTWGQLTH
jgi:hypothetical protein